MDIENMGPDLLARVVLNLDLRAVTQHTVLIMSLCCLTDGDRSIIVLEVAVRG